MKPCLEDNGIEMHSTDNEEKSVVAERFVKSLKNKIYYYMTSTSKNVYLDKLDDTVNKYNNAYNIKIKMKPVDVNSSTYIDFDKKNNKKNPKFKIGDHVKISKYKNIFAKGYILNWPEEVFVIKKLIILFHGEILLVMLMLKKLLECFIKKKLQKRKRNLGQKRLW